MRPEDYLSEHIKDAALALNLAKDYSGANAENVYIGPPASEVWDVARMLIEIISPAALVPTGWGSGAALTNGVPITVRNGADEIISDLTNGHPISDNGGWGGLCYDVKGFGGVNPTIDTYMHVRWTFAKAGDALTLQGHLGHRLCLCLDDDLSAGVSNLHILIQGQKKRNYAT